MNEIEEQNTTTLKCSAEDIIFDIKIIMSDFYNGIFSENDNKLKLFFENGQEFIISVKDCSEI